MVRFFKLSNFQRFQTSNFQTVFQDLLFFLFLPKISLVRPPPPRVYRPNLYRLVGGTAQTGGGTAEGVGRQLAGGSGTLSSNVAAFGSLSAICS